MSASAQRKVAKMREAFRRDGYDDGFAGRPARYRLAEYQVSYRRGQEARRRTNDGGEAA